jgi:hypothetical protein
VNMNACGPDIRIISMRWRDGLVICWSTCWSTAHCFHNANAHSQIFILVDGSPVLLGLAAIHYYNIRDLYTDTISYYISINDGGDTDFDGT